MCYILCVTSPSVFYVAPGMQGGLRGAIAPLCGGSRVCIFSSFFLCLLDFRVHCWVVFRHMVFSDGFLFLVKELGLLTNLGHWVRVLDAVDSYMYIVL
jgi:hypothetical protein